MKKVLICFSVVLLVFACTLPTSIEVRAKPELTIPASVDLGDKFSDIFQELKNSFESMDNSDFKILECNNVDTLTYVLYLPLVTELDSQDILKDIIYDTTLPPGTPDLPLNSDFFDGIKDLLPPGMQDDFENAVEDAEFVLEQDYLLYTSDSEGQQNSIQFTDLPDFISGFQFSGIKAKFFINGSEMVDTLKIEIEIGNPGGTVETSVEVNGRSGDVTGFNEAWTNCPWTAIPAGGTELGLQDLVNNRLNMAVPDDLVFKYRVLMEEGKTFKREWFEDANFQAELVIWFPFQLSARTGGAVIEFPDQDEMFGSDDLFGRSVDEEDPITESIKSMSISIKLKDGTTNPLKNGRLIFKNGNGNIYKEITFGNKSFDIDFDEAFMKKINEPVNIPLIPEMSVFFPAGSTLSVPRDFKFELTGLSFKASLSMKKNFSDLF